MGVRSALAQVLPKGGFRVFRVYVGYCPHTVKVDNRATILIQGLIYPFVGITHAAVAEWGQYPRFTAYGIEFRIEGLRVWGLGFGEDSNDETVKALVRPMLGFT